MNILWKRNLYLAAILISSLGIIRAPKIAQSFSALSPKKPVLIAQQGRFCRQLGSDFKEIHAFETRDYYINICRQENQFYYYRQSKSQTEQSILIPAEKVFDGNVYQAIDGKTTYFVGSNSDGYYSSVMNNNSEIIFEPEITVSTASAARSTPAINNAKPHQPSYEQEANWQVCTEDRSDVNPRLYGWQRFIGQSPETVNQYAVNNGHDFAYSQSEDNSTEALVNTADGLKVTMNISKIEATIGSVCVNPLTDT